MLCIHLKNSAPVLYREALCWEPSLLLPLVGIPGDWHLNTTIKQISQVGTEENVPVHWWHLKMCMGWIHHVWFPPSLPIPGADGADLAARACVCPTGRGALCLAATEKPWPTASSTSRFLVVSNFLWPFLHSDHPPLSAESRKHLVDSTTN